MGKDKYENEELLKYGFPEETWPKAPSVPENFIMLSLNLQTGLGRTFGFMWTSFRPLTCLLLSAL